MYRPPEMIDRYLKYTVNQKVDIWMLGCVVYSLCFAIHPFQDGKLASVNAYFKMPEDSRISNKLKDLIRNMLTPNPNKRISIFEIIKIVSNWSSISTIPLNVDI